MITREKNVNYSKEMKIIRICCQEVIEQQIIPELSLIYTLKISHYENFLKYILLMESVIKSAAIVQQLRHIKNNLQIDLPSHHLIHEIKMLKMHRHFNMKYNNIFAFYYHDQPQINAYLITAKSLFSPHTFIADLQYIIGLAHKGMSYTTDLLHYKLPATYYCYTKKFNTQLSVFLQNIISDSFDENNKKLYKKYHHIPISEQAFSSVITTLAFRLQLAVHFIEYFYSAQQLIEENNHEEHLENIENYFLQFLGKIRTETLFCVI